jgi:hypothetical protein
MMRMRSLFSHWERVRLRNKGIERYMIMGTECSGMAFWSWSCAGVLRWLHWSTAYLSDGV